MKLLNPPCFSIFLILFQPKKEAGEGGGGGDGGGDLLPVAPALLGHGPGDAPGRPLQDHASPGMEIY